MTIKDLARESGYSLGTVSRVLNGHPNVSEKARKAVMAIVEAQGFELNTNAKNLKQTQGNCVLVMVKGRGNELFASMVEQYQTIFAETGHPLIIDYIDELDHEVRRAAALCREKKPLGVLFLGGTHQNFREEFSKIRVPSVLVTVDARDLGFENLSSVAADDQKGAAAAVDYLLRCGHRDLMVLGADRMLSGPGHDRYAGCLEAHADYGLEFEESRYYTCRFSFHSGYEAMKRALDDGVSCTAVFAMADVIAIGAIRAIRERGLRVPEDISVVGYDGLVIGDFLQPRLSTVAQPTDAMAKRSAQMLLQQIKHNTKADHVTVPFSLDCKESVQGRR
ncbi:MAG: LacI family DNA-binding transcriptional regulator [Clostridia bacterium]|nr:LacI family DNA-binding transcriptional regulator [Clostridia bacterium]